MISTTVMDICRTGGGGYWLDRMKWRPAGWLVCRLC